MRLPLLSGTRVSAVRVPDDIVVIAAPPPHDPIVDVAAAAAQAIRHPLNGRSLEAVAARGGRVTILVEPPALPVPGVLRDPRQDAIAGILDELAAVGMAPGKHTLLVAAGLQRRPQRREIERMLRPARARDFSGHVAVHDVEADDLVLVGGGPGGPIRLNPALVETDLVVVVSAAETVVHGGAATLARAADALTARELSGSVSLLDARGGAWETAMAVETALERRVPVLGVSIVLDHPRLTGGFRSWPDRETADRLVRSPVRKLQTVLPSATRVGVLQGLERTLSAVSVLAGPPSVAHSEALLRGVALRAARLEQPLEALIVPVPWKSLHQPRQALNPITVLAAAAHATRLWRERPPIVPNGTLIVPHPFTGAVGQGPEEPYLRLFHAIRAGAEGRKLTAVERLARNDARALDRYRRSKTVHPLLPFADWADVRATLDSIGRVVVAGCRDATAAKALGCIPTHNLQTAFTMAMGVAGTDGPIGILLAPPFAPITIAS